MKSIVASTKAVDPALDALFASSVRPVDSTSKPKYTSLIVPKPRTAPTPKSIELLGEKDEDEEQEDEDEDEDEDDDGDDEDDSDDESEADEEGEDQDEGADETSITPIEPSKPTSKRKRKTRDDDEGLEVRYLEKISRESVMEPAGKRAKQDEEATAQDKDDNASDIADKPIVHESIRLRDSGVDVDTFNGVSSVHDAEVEKDKGARTVFLSNVSIEAVTSKSAKKTLLAHLTSIPQPKKGGKGAKEAGKEAATAGTTQDTEDKEDKHKSVVESIRFRSVPFATAALPKRAAYITKAVLTATAQATNAYVVYTTAAAARAAVHSLNGTVVLGRHLRADSVAHPAPVDHRRCVFVGNLGFVDDETVTKSGVDEEGEEITTTRQRHKVPMDVEEGLWCTFGKLAGRVESVRVVRDAATRVGKGIAYVQFYDATSVEAALLLADKKFPPLLPRSLRVSRCKAPHKTARAIERAVARAKKDVGVAGNRLSKKRGRAGDASPADASPVVKKNKSTGYTPQLTAEQQTLAGRAAKLLGRAAAAADAQPMVFEGMRARVGHNSNLFKKNKNNKTNKNGGKGSNNKERRANRAAKWRGKN